MTREHLLETVWGYDYFGDVRTVDVTVRRLRENNALPAEAGFWRAFIPFISLFYLFELSRI